MALAAWYSLALALTAAGLGLATFFVAASGSVGWLAKLALYLSGIGHLIASWSGYRVALTKGLSLERSLTEFSRDPAANYSALVEMSNDPIIAFDAKHRVLCWNPAATRMFGYKQSEAIGSLLSDLILPAPFVDALVRDLGAVAQDEAARLTPQIRVTEARTKAGQQLPVELSLSVRPAWGGWIGTCIIHDISERKRAEDESRALHVWLEQQVAERTAQLETVGRDLAVAANERRRAEQLVRQVNLELASRVLELEAANRELESFTYSVSHDLRAPLRAIDGFSRILLEEKAAQLDTDSERYLQLVRSNALQMGRLIDDLLRLSRFGRQSLQKQTVAMGDLVRQAIEDLRGEQEGRRIEMVVGDLPPCWADPALLKQVWVNLLSNALKFTRQRPVAHIEVGCRDQGGQTVYFIRDNGVGFDMQYASRLFGVFQRLHSAEEYEGTGVGLAIVQRIIHRHGGRVWAESAVDKGAIFSFTLGGSADEYASTGDTPGRRQSQ